MEAGDGPAGGGGSCALSPRPRGRWSCPIAGCRGPHRQDLCPGEDRRSGGSPFRPGRRGGPLQRPSGALGHRGDPLQAFPGRQAAGPPSCAPLSCPSPVPPPRISSACGRPERSAPTAGCLSSERRYSPPGSRPARAWRHYAPPPQAGGTQGPALEAGSACSFRRLSHDRIQESPPLNYKPVRFSTFLNICETAASAGIGGQTEGGKLMTFRHLTRRLPLRESGIPAPWRYSALV